EDRKKAEQEGIAVTALRRARPADAEPERRWVDKDLSITVQVMLSPGVSGRSWGSGQGGACVLLAVLPGGNPPARSVFWGLGGFTPHPGVGGGEWEERRRQNIEKMNEEMEKIAEYERNQRDGLHEKNPVRNFLDDPCRSGPFQEADRKEGSRRHVRNWGGTDFHKVKAGMEREKTWQGPVPGGLLDMTLSMTGRERAEYVRWKKEREQIDQERLARHRKPTGQWRREWDAEKSDSMFKEGSAALPGSEMSVGEENKRPPPKPLTFGEFLTPHRTQRRRKGWGCGQGTGTKPYRLVGLHFNEDLEDEDQWEDVSEEEEEEGGGGSTNPGLSSKDEAPCSASPKAQRPPRAGQAVAPKLHVPPTTVAPVPDGGAGTPLSPFSPVEGHQPISDWGEEMDLASPRSTGRNNPGGGRKSPACTSVGGFPKISSVPMGEVGGAWHRVCLGVEDASAGGSVKGPKRVWGLQLCTPSSQKLPPKFLPLAGHFGVPLFPSLCPEAGQDGWA
uniref:Coiled-coil domain containing 9 n=1 Tax=Buteo japonicus TaxID=224669 RepID=A0A8B9ZAA0_9AVES